MSALSGLLFLAAVVVAAAAIPALITLVVVGLTRLQRPAALPAISASSSRWSWLMAAVSSVALYGLAVAGGLAAEHRFPQGVVLYTPIPNQPIQYTPSFPVSFSVVLALGATTAWTVALVAVVARWFLSSNSVLFGPVRSVSIAAGATGVVSLLGAIGVWLVPHVSHP